MKVALSLTIQEVENRNMPTFLSETALSVARCTSTCTTCTCTCCCNNGDSNVEAELSVV